MSHQEAIERLESKITHMERHIEAQDTEIYSLAKHVEALSKTLSDLRDCIHSMNEKGGSNGDIMPANEKPPHY